MMFSLLICKGLPSIILFFLVFEGEYCSHETFNARCSTGEIIQILSAHYGHISLGRCIKVDVGHFGCMADVTGALSIMCNEEQSCQMDVDSDELRSLEPCPGMAVFLKISYACLKGGFYPVAHLLHLPE